MGVAAAAALSSAWLGQNGCGGQSKTGPPASAGAATSRSRSATADAAVGERRERHWTHCAVTAAHSPRQAVGARRGDCPPNSAGEREPGARGERGLSDEVTELAVSGALSELTLSWDRRRSDVMSGRGGPRRRPETDRDSSMGMGLSSGGAGAEMEGQVSSG